MDITAGVSRTAITSERLAWPATLLACLLLLLLLAVDLQRDLPLAFEADEPSKVLAAVAMNARGDLNPGWFGHPASTLIYPLTVILHLREVLFFDGQFLQANPQMMTRYEADLSSFYMISRWLSIVYAIGCVPLLLLLGRKLFPLHVVLPALFLLILVPDFVYWAQQARSDTAATFFGLLSLLAVVRLGDTPEAGRAVAAGAAIGLAVASRYFMVALTPLVPLVLLLRSKRPSWRRLTVLTLLTALVCVTAFFLISPYILLDADGFADSMRRETREVQYGHDGLGFVRHLGWYLGVAAPKALGWPQTLLAAFGLLFCLRRPQRRLLPLYVLLFITTISIPSLHWQRWIYPLLPLLALCCSAAIFAIARQRRAVVVLLFVLAAAYPLSHSARATWQHLTEPTTRMMARQWIMANVAPGSTLMVERYSTILEEDGEYELLLTGWNPGAHDLDLLRQQGAQYVVLNMTYYAWFAREPQRFAANLAFLERLQAEGELLATFSASYQPPLPSLYDGRATVQIYRLAP